MTPNSDFQFIHKESGNSMTTAKLQSARLLPHWRPSSLSHIFFFKIINIASVETEDILTPADSRTRRNHSFKFKHLQANCDSYRYSFFPATISSWNNLPFGIEKVDSVEGFKLKLKQHTFRSP